MIEIFYNGSCPFCTKVKNFLTKLDRRKNLEFTDLSMEPYATEIYGVSSEDAFESIVAAEYNSRVFRGWDVLVRAIYWCGYRRTSIVLNAPIVRHLGKLAYFLLRKFL